MRSGCWAATERSPGRRCLKAIGLVWLIGIYAIVVGIGLLGLAFRLRGLGWRLTSAGAAATSARLLVVEITESAIKTDPVQSLQVLGRLSQMAGAGRARR